MKRTSENNGTTGSTPVVGTILFHFHYYILMSWYPRASETDSGGAFGVDCFLWFDGALGQGSSKDQVEEPTGSARK